MTKPMTTIAVSVKVKHRIIKEIIHPYEDETGINCSYDRAIWLLLDKAKSEESKCQKPKPN